MATKYKLTYFNAQARAEVARLLFVVADVEYEDVRVNADQWAIMKPTCPNGQLPVLEINGEMFCQSYAFQRYLAKEFGLAGKTPLDEFRADMIVDTLEDLLQPILPSFYLQDEEEKMKLVKAYENEKLPTLMQNLESILIANNGGESFFVGKELTWADLNFTHCMEWLGKLKVTIDWSKTPKLAELRKRVLTIPRIAAWIEKRPETRI